MPLASGRFTLPDWLLYPFVGLLCCWIFAYGSGLFPYLGWKSGGYHSLPGPIGGVSYGIGKNRLFQVHHVFLVSGQTLFVDYDAEIRSGSLRIELAEGYVLNTQTLAQHEVTESGSGRVSAVAPSTGMYSIYFRPTSPQIGVPIDVSYDLSWGGLWGSNP